MAINYKMKMLWHAGFWDGPLNGLGEYNREKVWFQIEDDCTILKEEDYSQEIKSIIENYKFNENDRNLIGSTDDYEIFYWDEVSYPLYNGETYTIKANFNVTHKLTYKIYRLPEDVLQNIEQLQQLREEHGLFNSLHDPAKFKPYDASVAKLKEYYEIIKTKPKCKVEIGDLGNYELLDTVKYDEIEWLVRPYKY